MSYALSRLEGDVVLSPRCPEIDSGAGAAVDGLLDLLGGPTCGYNL
jgi:hypothetical protein